MFGLPIEVWIVCATILGPVIAVQTQKFIERASEKRNRRLWIFNALMANRATRLNDDYVKALNLIDLVFLPRWFSKRKDRNVINAWRGLFGELNHGLDGTDRSNQAISAWHQRCDDRLVALLSAMSIALGYYFSDEELRRGIYYPVGLGERDDAQLAVLKGFRSVVEGRQPISMRIVEAPGAPETAALQAQLTEKMVTAYDQDGALKVRIIPANE